MADKLVQNQDMVAAIIEGACKGHSIDERAVRLVCLVLAAQMHNPQRGENWETVLVNARWFERYVELSDIPGDDE